MCTHAIQEYKTWLHSKIKLRPEIDRYYKLNYGGSVGQTAQRSLIFAMVSKGEVSITTGTKNGGIIKNQQNVLIYLLV